MREVGVGYDGSPESKGALALARIVAAEHRTRLSAFHAVSIPAYVNLGVPAPVDAESIQLLVDQARERIAALGGVEPHSAVRRPGRGTHALQRLARSFGCGLEGLRSGRQAGLWRGGAAARPDRPVPSARAHALGTHGVGGGRRGEPTRRQRLGELNGRTSRAHQHHGAPEPNPGSTELGEATVEQRQHIAGDLFKPDGPFAVSAEHWPAPRRAAPSWSAREPRSRRRRPTRGRARVRGAGIHDRAVAL